MGGGGAGAPQYWVSTPFINLRIEDLPNAGAYQPALGPRLDFRISYRLRGAATEDPNIFGVGTNWSCSFRAYLVDLLSSQGQIALHSGGAGYIGYTPGAPEPADGSILTPLSPGPGYQIEHGDGSIETFGKQFTAGDGTTCYFLTFRKDPLGKTLTFNYDSNPGYVRLTSVTDPDNNSTMIFYEDATYTNQITKVAAFGRTNILHYSASGYLDSITDAASLTSTFSYTNASHPEWVTSMATPYGSTYFTFGGSDVQNTTFLTTGTSPNRWLQVTLPNGGHELYLFRQDCSDFLSASNWAVPSTSPLANNFDSVDQQYRNSFYWSPLQFGALSAAFQSGGPDALTTADYTLAQMRHWLKIAGNSSQAGDTLSLERDPSPDGSTQGEVTWYDYSGRTSANVEGTNSQPTFVAQILPTGATHFTQRDYGTHGQPTKQIETFT
jgi:YD repeat-containing protein